LNGDHWFWIESRVGRSVSRKSSIQTVPSSATVMTERPVSVACCGRKVARPCCFAAKRSGRSCGHFHALQLWCEILDRTRRSFEWESPSNLQTAIWIHATPAGQPRGLERRILNKRFISAVRATSCGRRMRAWRVRLSPPKTFIGAGALYHGSKFAPFDMSILEGRISPVRQLAF
jgi:hypothetical protein